MGDPLPVPTRVLPPPAARPGIPLTPVGIPDAPISAREWLVWVKWDAVAASVGCGAGASDDDGQGVGFDAHAEVTRGAE